MESGFRHTGCLIVQPDWNHESSFEPYALTQDVKLITQQERGAIKRITHVRLLSQDVIGEAGIQHDTDWIPVAVPVTPDRSGGTLHVHAANIEVWRRSGHTGGTRVEIIGRDQHRRHHVPALGVMRLATRTLSRQLKSRAAFAAAV